MRSGVAPNGEADRFVQTFKHVMRAGEKDEGSLSYKLANFLIFIVIPDLYSRLDVLKSSLQ